MDFSLSDGLIFDCDGTLADTMPFHFIAWQSTFDRHGIDFSEDRFYAMAGQPTANIIRTLLAEHGIEGDANAIAAEKESAFLENLDEVQPVKPIVEIAQQYRSTHRMGVGSGSNLDVVIKILNQIGLAEFFDCVVGSEDTSRHKPEPDVFLEVARRIEIDPLKCCVFEDADLGVEAAKRAGMACFDIRTVHQPRRITSA